jgi:hypothetical protein
VSLWAEELTSMEVRDAVRAGTTTIIVGTGGVEQSGPYVVGGKHNYVLQTVLLTLLAQRMLSSHPSSGCEGICTNAGWRIGNPKICPLWFSRTFILQR